jgi:Ca-activated chloride channel homolog
MRVFVHLLFLCLIVSASMASPRTQVKQGNEAAMKGLKDAALMHYLKALEQKGDTSVILYDLGNLKYESGDYENSQKYFEGALDPKESKAEQSQTLYNLGNSYYQAKQYDKAVKAYAESLKRNPKDNDAKYNLELALREMRRQQQQQQDQQNQDKQDQKKEDKKQDQQKNQDQQNQEQKPDSSQQQQEQQAQQQQQDSTQQQQQPQNSQDQQMSQEDAERLLNALLQDEQNALDKVKKAKVQARAKRDKDW